MLDKLISQTSQEIYIKSEQMILGLISSFPQGSKMQPSSIRGAKSIILYSGNKKMGRKRIYKFLLNILNLF